MALITGSRSNIPELFLEGLRDPCQGSGKITFRGRFGRAVPDDTASFQKIRAIFSPPLGKR